MAKSFVRVCLVLPVVIAISFQPAAAADLWIYTALGDSLAFGVFAPPGFGYVPAYQRHVGTDTGNTVWLNPLGIPGWTSSDLAQALKTNWYFRASIRNSRVITINIGGNDLRIVRSAYKAGSCGGSDNQDCLKAGVLTFQSNWNSILTELLTLRNTTNTIIRTMDIYNPYVSDDMAADSWLADGGLNDFQVLNPYLLGVNTYIVQTTSAVGIPCAPVHLIFNGVTGTEDPAAKGFIAFDGFHANWLGHAVMAHLLRLLGYAPLFP